VCVSVCVCECPCICVCVCVSVHVFVCVCAYVCVGGGRVNGGQGGEKERCILHLSESCPVFQVRCKGGAMSLTHDRSD